MSPLEEFMASLHQPRQTNDPELTVALDVVDGVSLGLCHIAQAINNLADAVREKNDI